MRIPRSSLPSYVTAGGNLTTRRFYPHFSDSFQPALANILSPACITSQLFHVAFFFRHSTVTSTSVHSPSSWCGRMHECVKTWICGGGILHKLQQLFVPAYATDFKIKWASDPDDLQSKTGTEGLSKAGMHIILNAVCLSLASYAIWNCLGRGVCHKTHILSSKWNKKFCLFCL